MPALEPAAPAGALAVARGHRRHRSEHRTLPGPTAIERQVIRTATRRTRRREVDAAEQRALVAQFVARAPTDRRRHGLIPENIEEPTHRVGRYAGGLEAHRIGVEQVLIVVRAAPKLPRDVVERLVEREGP